jgi:hypothetical protein
MRRWIEAAFRDEMLRVELVVKHGPRVLTVASFELLGDWCVKDALGDVIRLRSRDGEGALKEIERMFGCHNWDPDRDDKERVVNALNHIHGRVGVVREDEPLKVVLMQDGQLYEWAACTVNLEKGRINCGPHGRYEFIQFSDPGQIAELIEEELEIEEWDGLDLLEQAIQGGKNG